MKTLFTLSLLFVSFFANAQTFSEQLKKALANDDVNLLAAEIKTKNLKLTDCIDIEGVKYNLLALSVKLDKPEIFKSLIAQKADLNQICSDKSPLMFAAKYGRLEMAKALIVAGADVKLRSDEEKTALDYAVKYQQKALVTLLSSKAK